LPPELDDEVVPPPAEAVDVFLPPPPPHPDAIRARPAAQAATSVKRRRR
jgi:hypothetical protein